MTFRAWLLRASDLLQRKKRERELEEELELHLEMATQEKISQGMSPEEARFSAYRDFGGVEQIKELYRDQRGLPFVDHLGQDFRLALRSLLRRPGFAIVSMLLLGLGIGGVTSIFSVVNAVLLAPLPGVDTERILALQAGTEQRPVGGNPARLKDWQQLESFEAVAGYYGDSAVLLEGGEPRKIPVRRTFGPFLEVAGARLQLGRGPSQVEGRGEGDAVAMISDRLWKRSYGGSEQVLGQSLLLDGKSHSIIGVLAAKQYPKELDAWIPAPVEFQQADRTARYLGIFGRLAEGVTKKEAQAEVDAVAARLAWAYPATDEDLEVRLVEPKTLLTREVRTPVLLVLLASCCLLLLACLNLAGLLWARAQARQREASIRIALGAGTGRLARFYLTETLLVASLGGVAGLVVAHLALAAVAGAAERHLPLLEALTLDYRVISVGLLAAILCGLALGLVPIWLASRVDPVRGLKQGGEGFVAGRLRLRSFLVSSQIALSMVLVVCTALLTKSFLQMTSVPLGFEPSQVLSIKTNFAWGTPPETLYSFIDEALTELSALPGVRYVGVADRLPLEGESQRSPLRLRDRPPEASLEEASVLIRSVSPGYFSALGIPLRAGELLPAHRDRIEYEGSHEEESAGGGRLGSPVVINEALAQVYFGSESPIGRWISFPYGDQKAPPTWQQVVGVVGDVRQSPRLADSQPEVFLAYRDTYWPILSFVLRTQGDPILLAKPAREALRRVDASLVVSRLGTLEHELGQSVSNERIQTLLMAAFALLALILAATGLYGLLSTDILRRSREFGIRLALGAQPSDILWSALRPALLLTLLGGIAGLLLSLLAGGFLKAMLFETSTMDLGALLAALFVLYAASALAAILPARRGTRIDPVRTLGSD
ncbi:MAG: ADOP family duplicated permease [Deltaproteobacteria bacterium]|nr:ADOP family duplicated permease [Deltaproteobacteria bacterium]